MQLAAVTVNWNLPELTHRCVASLLAGTRAPDWVIVVDNGSRVDPTARLQRDWPHVEVLRNGENVGFAAGANVGLRRAVSLGADAVLVINNDAVAEPSCVMELQRALERDSGLAAVGAKTLTEETPPRIHTAYGMITFHGQLVRITGWLEPNVDLFNEQCEVDYVSGCAMLMRRNALDAVGLFDPEFFAYHEDLDWCTRARRAGFRVAYVPAARVRHRMHASTGGGGYVSPIVYLSQRNSILFLRKNATAAQRCKYAVHLAVNLVKDAVFRLRRGEIAGFRLRLRGLLDGLLRRPLPLAELGLRNGRD